MTINQLKLYLRDIFNNIQWNQPLDVALGYVTRGKSSRISHGKIEEEKRAISWPINISNSLFLSLEQYASSSVLESVSFARSVPVTCCYLKKTYVRPICNGCLKIEHVRV